MSQGGVTHLLLAWRAGDASARDALLAVVYDELRRRASSYLRRERAGHALQATALVHEAYLKLVDQDRVVWQNRAHFMAVAAQIMRRILVDHARARHADKRGGLVTRISLQEILENEGAEPHDPAGAAEDVLAVDTALEQLAAIDPDQAVIVELRFFGGLNIDETATVLKRSPRTIKREWRLARAWLYRALRG
jgi:RNA polymerase sigma-70 factor (ECF subfamily)